MAQKGSRLGWQVRKIGLLHQPRSEAARSMASHLAGLIQKIGPACVISSIPEDLHFVRNIHDLDLLITLGGDGTVLRGARLAVAHCIPLLGVNLGHLGFLTEIEPEEVDHLLPRILHGDFSIDERMMLQVSVLRQSAVVLTAHALSDVVIRRGISGQALRLSISIDGLPLTTYVADGLILSTPTGSTGYSLSAGGAVVHPHLPSISLTPISPHLTPLRALVLPEGAIVRVTLSLEENASLSTDGSIDTPLEDRDELITHKSPHTCRFLRLHPKSHFNQTLVPKLVRGVTASSV